MVELTFQEYQKLGGVCPENLFERAKMEVSIMLNRYSQFYIMEWCIPEISRPVAMTAMIDASYYSISDEQNGGQVVSIKVGSYSETKGSTGAGNLYSDSARFAPLIEKFFALKRRKIGVISQ